MIASSMILFPAVFATMSMLSRMGTPLLTIVPRVRENRATATLLQQGAEDREPQQQAVDVPPPGFLP